MTVFNVYNGAGSKQTWIAGGGNTTITFPTITDTLVTKTSTDALTNKTVNGNTITAGTGTLTLNTNSLGVSGGGVSLNLSGTGTTTQTFPTTSATLARTDAGQTFTGTQLFSGAVGISNTVAIVSASASALAVGLNGATNPAFQVDASTALQATGIKITGLAAAGGVSVSAISSGANENLVINAKGSGQLILNNTASGSAVLGSNGVTTVFKSAITYGGVTLANSVSGTGSMALTIGTTFTGTTTVATLAVTTVNLSGTFSGGGNQLNNIIIGASTPLAGTFTTLTANTSISSPIHASPGAHTFQSNGSTFAGQITTGQQWVLGTNTTPPASPVLTVTKNAATLPGIGAATPLVLIAQADATQPTIAIQSFNASNAFLQPGVILAKARGTAASPASVQSGDAVASIFGFAYTTTTTPGYVTTAGAGFLMTATDNCTPTACGTRIDVDATAAGSATMGTPASFGAGVMIGTTTDPGAGGLTATGASINFTALANSSTTSSVCYNTGTGRLTFNGTVGTCTVSDERLKNVVGPIGGALDKLLAINGFYYTWKDASLGSGLQIGVGAQTVERAFPELVQTDSTGRKSVDYQRLTAPIIEAMRELKAENDNLHIEISELKKVNRR